MTSETSDLLAEWNKAQREYDLATHRLAAGTQCYLRGEVSRAELEGWALAQREAERARDLACREYKASYQEGAP